MAENKAILPDNAVAWDHPRLRINVQRVAHHAAEPRVSDGTGDLSVGRHASIRNEPHRRVNFLKGRHASSFSFSTSGPAAVRPP